MQKKQKGSKRAGKKPKSTSTALVPYRAPRTVGPMVQAPSAQSAAYHGGTAKLTGSNAKLVVRHSEAFDVPTFVVGGAFQQQTYRVNPGLSDCFPWLSAIANRYEMYRFLSLCFTYRTRAATSASGTVGLIFDHDALDPPPHDFLEALSYHEKIADAPWKDLVLKIDLTNDAPVRRYTRAGSVPGNADLKTYDLGNLTVFSDGLQGGYYSPGLLEVTYEVELCIPQIDHPVAGVLRATAGTTPTNLFGTPASLTYNSNSVPAFVSDGQKLTFLEDWSGQVVGNVEGASLSTNWNTGLSTALLQLTNSIGVAAGVLGVWAVQARKGQTFQPMLSLGTVNQSTWSWTGAAFEQLQNVFALPY